MLTKAVIGARYGPILAGIIATNSLDIASTMPVPDKIPVKIPAAKLNLQQPRYCLRA